MDTNIDLKIGKDIQWCVVEEVVSFLSPSHRQSLRLLSREFDGFIMGVSLHFYSFYLDIF